MSLPRKQSEPEPTLTQHEGTSAVIAALAQRHGRRAFAVAYDLLRSPADAEDAVQEALVRAAKSYHTLRNPEAIEGWFFRALTNWCLKVLRRRRVKASLAHLWKKERAVSPPAFESRLMSELSALPPKQHSAIVLHHCHDYSVAEVASLLDVKPSTVKTHLARGLGKLRMKLGDQQ